MYLQVDPFALVNDNIASLGSSIKQLLVSHDLLLEEAAQYLFKTDGGKKVRPSMVLLLSRAAHADSRENPSRRLGGEPDETELQLIRARQLRLAQVTEMYHVSSLLHDDVIDMAESRRSAPSVNHVHGNRVVIINSITEKCSAK